MKIAAFSVKNYQFTVIIFIMALLLGMNALFNMPRGEDPPFGAPIFIILAIYPGTSPADMEELVADPLEDVLYELDDIKRIDTNCGDGVMLMKVEFTFGVDVDSKNNDVIREVNRLRPELPSDLLSLEVQRAASSDVAILQHALVSSTAGYEELRKQAEKLQKNLEKVKDLKRVEIQALPEQEVEISIDLEKMAQFRLGLNQVLNLIEASNINIPGGHIDLGPKRFNIKTESDFDNLENIRNTVVQTTREGHLVHLRDIASIRMTDEEISHMARFNGERSIWVVTLLKDRKNILQVEEKVQPIIDKFTSDLPADIRLEKAFDQSESVNRRLGHLGRDFMIAIFLVLLTLLPLGTRASLVVMISIPLSLSIGLALLDLFHYTLNQLSIVGMVVALGLLVDDSIVVVENIERFMRQGYSRKEAAIVATKQIGIAVIGCTATLLLAFLPLAFLPEGSGDFIRSLPMAVMLTVIASLFVAITIIPFLSSLLLRNEERPEGNFFMRLFKRWVNQPYQKVLGWSFRHPVISLLGATVIFVLSLLLVPRIGFSLFPLSEKPMFLVNIETPLGTNLDETNRITRDIEKNLESEPEIISLTTNVGKGNPRVYYNEFQRENSPNYAQILVQVEPEMLVPEITGLADKLRERYAAYPGAEIRVIQFQQGPPVVAPVEFRLFGENLDTLRNLSFQVEELIKNTEGTIYVTNPLRTQKTDLLVAVNREKAGLLGIPLAEVAKTVRLSMTGLNIGALHTDDGDSYDIKATIGKDPQETIETFSRIYVTSLAGELVPLSQIADIRMETSPSVIKHYNKDRYISIGSFVQTGYNTDALTDEIIAKLDNFKFPEGFTFVAAGERESREESFGGIQTIIIISVFGLLGILVLEFRTFKSTIIVLSVIPLGIIGALVTLFLIGETLSFVTTIGMIALVGIEIKNSILLVDYTNQLREQGMPLEQAIMEGAETRFLPILLTTMTAIGGLIPLVLENSPLISPLAWVLIGGLISSTLLSRIVTPLLYKLLPPKVS